MVEVISKSSPDVRIIFDMERGRIKIVSTDGYELASFQSLGKAELLKNFKTLADDKEHKKISLIATKENNTYIVGSIAPINSKKIPIEDLVIPIKEGTRHFVAAFTVTVGKKNSEFPNGNNVSLLVSTVDREAPKGYKSFVRALENYLQVLTAAPFNEKEIEKLTTNFNKAILVVDKLKAKYPAQSERYELIKNSLLELSQEILKFIGLNSSRSYLNNKNKLPAQIIQIAYGLLTFVRTYDHEANENNEKDENEVVDDKNGGTDNKNENKNENEEIVATSPSEDDSDICKARRKSCDSQGRVYLPTTDLRECKCADCNTAADCQKYITKATQCIENVCVTPPEDCDPPNIQVKRKDKTDQCIFACNKEEKEKCKGRACSNGNCLLPGECFNNDDCDERGKYCYRPPGSGIVAGKCGSCITHKDCEHKNDVLVYWCDDYTNPPNCSSAWGRGCNDAGGHRSKNRAACVKNPPASPSPT